MEHAHVARTIDEAQVRHEHSVSLSLLLVRRIRLLVLQPKLLEALPVVFGVHEWCAVAVCPSSEQDEYRAAENGTAKTGHAVHCADGHEDSPIGCPNLCHHNLCHNTVSGDAQVASPTQLSRS